MHFLGTVSLTPSVNSLILDGSVRFCIENYTGPSIVKTKLVRIGCIIVQHLGSIRHPLSLR